MRFDFCQILIQDWHDSSKQNLLHIVVAKYIQLLFLGDFLIVFIVIVYRVLNLFLVCLNDLVICNSLQLLLHNLKVQTILQISYFLAVDELNEVLHSFVHIRVLRETVFEHTPV